MPHPNKRPKSILQTRVLSNHTFLLVQYRKVARSIRPYRRTHPQRKTFRVIKLFRAIVSRVAAAADTVGSLQGPGKTLGK